MSALFSPMMRLSIIATLLIGVLAVACSDDDGGGDGDASIKVVATTIQIAALTEEVAGDRAEVISVIPAGSDPHDFEPTASDLQAIADADLILRHGIGLDAFLDDMLSGSSAPVVTVTDGLDLQPPALELEHEEEGEEHEEGEFDPHVWHDPELDKGMVDNILAALIGAGPDDQAAYEVNADAYKTVLDETDAEIETIIAEIPDENRKLVTNHDAMGYFARAYGLEVVGAVIPADTTAAEPSAEDTAELLDTIEREGVRAIFAESSVTPDLAEQLANDAGVEIVDNLYGDSLGEPGSAEGTVHGMLLYNARLIADALR